MKKKNLKGTTLLEVIIALAIFAMLGVILVTLGSNVDKQTKSSVKLNKRVALQAPYAASQQEKHAVEQGDGTYQEVELTNSNSSIRIFIDKDKDGNPDDVDVKRENGNIDKISSQANVSGKRYTTEDIVTGDTEAYDPEDVSNSRHHLQFIKVSNRIEVDFSGVGNQIKKGETREITVDKVAEDGTVTNEHITGAVWTHKSADAEKVATIDADGTITAVGAGSCTYHGYDDEGRRFIVKIIVYN